MPQKPDYDVSKLPKWAQNEIKRLRGDLEYYKARASVGSADTNTFAYPYDACPKPLERDAIIQFQVNPSSKVRVGIVQTPRGPELDINGDHPIQLLPTASNAIRVRL